jgi:hypothetical protein
MPNFKPKSNKKFKYNKKASITLDTKHKEFLNEFDKDQFDIIPEFKIERDKLKEIFNNDEKLSMEQRLDLQDRINEISEKILELKNKKKEYIRGRRHCKTSCAYK